jgi:hypothetical protein
MSDFSIKEAREAADATRQIDIAAGYADSFKSSISKYTHSDILFLLEENAALRKAVSYWQALAEER